MEKIRLSEKMEQTKWIQSIRKFMLSKTFMVIQCLIAAAFIIARGKTEGRMIILAYGVLCIGAILCIVMIFCDDVIATLLPFLLASSIAIKCYDSFDIFIKFVWFAPIPVFALLFHMIVYRQKLDWGKTWPGAAAVSVAVTLGGLGKITFAEYFNGSALYHTFGLGIGMFILYLIMNSKYHSQSKYYELRFHFSFIMTLVGTFCVFMICHHYALYWTNFLAKLSPIYFQWRNNVSTILMLTMPFAFFLSSKKYPYIFLGILQYAGILLTGSRGGALGGTVELGLCLCILIYSDVKNRKRNLILIASTVVASLALFLEPLIRFLGPVLTRLTNGDDVRMGLIRRAVEDFKSNVLFGRGLGYNGNNDVHDPAKFALCWYHSAPFQVIGSFGLLGVAAYVFQFFNRMKVVWARTTHFNITLFISYAGLFLMSLVNPGEFCPVPYGLVATLLFIICDKNNIAAENSDNTEKENIVNLI